MKELLERMIIGLRKQVEERVPKEGSFPMVYEDADVSEMGIRLSYIILKVSPTEVKGSENNRFLELGGVKNSCPYGAECVMGYGTTQAILARLQEDQLLDDLLKKIPKLIDDIEYEEMHPWG